MKQLIENKLMGKSSLIRLKIEDENAKIRKIKNKIKKLEKEYKLIEQRLKELGVK